MAEHQSDCGAVSRESAIVGCLLGTAVGDALGLPYEGLSRQRAARLLGPPDRYRLLPGRGMVSDDTEHTCMVAQALIESGGDADAFGRHLARRLRYWLLGMPAGIGLATLRSILRLWIGIGPDRSGVFSAGNGPAMRSAILGAAVEDRVRLKQLVRASARITHSDPKSEYAALAVALAAQFSGRGGPITPASYLNELRLWLGPEGAELTTLVAAAAEAAKQGSSTLSFCHSLGLARGVTGYSYHTVPVVVHAWLTHPRDFRAAVLSTIECGGDTDSTAAIVGGIVGAAVGKEGIPPEWLAGLAEWPRTVPWMEQLACELAAHVACESQGLPPRLPLWALLLRNAWFAAVVLVHALRRLLP